MKQIIINLIVVLTIITSVNTASDYFVCTKYQPYGNHPSLDYSTQYLIEDVEDLEEGDMVIVSIDNGNITDVSYVGWVW